MARSSNYPAKSFDTALNLAEEIDKLGGKCSIPTIGDKLNKKVSGGSFQNEINAAVKHGLITKEKDVLKITQQFSDIKLAYTDEEKNRNLQTAFLLPDTYREILERFEGKELPEGILDRILIREYEVTTGLSKSVTNNILKGAAKVGLIKDGVVHLPNSTVLAAIEELAHKESQEEEYQKSAPGTANDNNKDIPKSENQIQKLKSGVSNVGKDVAININIQLSVPETTNEEVYEKFFAAMKKHLLS